MTETGKKQKRKNEHRHGLPKEKLKPKTSCSISKNRPNSTKTKPKSERASGVFKENLTGKNNAFNSDVQHAENDNKYTLVILFMRDA